MVWLDRKKPKKTLKEWIEKHNYITLNISDPREIEDIENCFKSHLENDFRIGRAVLNSGLINNELKILQSLVDDLGGKTRFINYYNLLRNSENNDIIYIQLTQEIAKNIKANSVTINDIKQDPIHIEQQNSKSSSKEEKVSKLLDEFIDDLNNFNPNNYFLFIIKFLEGGYSELDNEFKYWFKESFIKKMSLIENVKIVVLDQGNPDMRLKSDQHIDIDETVDYNDIYDFIKAYQETEFPRLSSELHTQLLAILLMSTDGRESSNVKYKEASRTFHIFSKLASTLIYNNDRDNHDTLQEDISHKVKYEDASRSFSTSL